MNKVFITGSFCFGFTARLIQVSLEVASMAGSSASFEPFGDMWCLLSSCAYGLVCALVVLAVLSCDKRSRTTILALALAGGLLLADFIKPSRFEQGTCLDRVIHLIGIEQNSVFHDQWSVAKGFGSLAKL